MHVSNILPRTSFQLTYDQYNGVLREFHDRFACPAADSLGVKVELGTTEHRIEDILSARAVEALREFSSDANRSMLHPLDRERWNTFLTIAHLERAVLKPELLRRWLVEEERWPEGAADDLMIEYEIARGLLKTYEAYEPQHV